MSTTKLMNVETCRVSVRKKKDIKREIMRGRTGLGYHTLTAAAMAEVQSSGAPVGKE